MEHARYLECLAADFDRLRAVVVAGPDGDVPSCPGWTVSDLTRHVGEVYLHKSLAMRDGAEPEPWPPAELAAEEPLALLDRAYAALTAEFEGRKPADAAGSWYTPDQTVGFWGRRMAQETVVHRIDAELGTGVAVAPVPDDLAIDGIDELLRVFVAFSVRDWGSYFTGILDGSPGRTFLIRAGDTAWTVRTGPGVFEVGGEPPAAPDVTIGGEPAAVLRWLWNRGPVTVDIDGPEDAVAELRACITTATQ